MRRLLCLISLAFFSSCVGRLQAHSERWDHAQTPRRSPPQTQPQVVTKPSTKPSAAPTRAPDSRWKIAPPDLETQSTHPVVDIAQRYLGVPYRYGGASPETGFDCSGLVHYIFQQRGQHIARLANAQYHEGRAVERTQLLPGDLVFFSVSGKDIDHVGIYAGQDLFIHAPRTGRTVSYDSLISDYFAQRYQGARRLN